MSFSEQQGASFTLIQSRSLAMQKTIVSQLRKENNPLRFPSTLMWNSVWFPHAWYLITFYSGKNTLDSKADILFNINLYKINALPALMWYLQFCTKSKIRSIENVLHRLISRKWLDHGTEHLQSNQVASIKNLVIKVYWTLRSKSYTGIEIKIKTYCNLYKLIV